MGVAVFEARGVTKTYRVGDVEVHALRGVDLDLFPGELLVLLGPSGSGKSTLLNILGGLDLPTTGRVRYRDRDLTALDDAGLTAYRREHVGFVFQFYNLIPSLTALENAALVTEIADHPMEPAEALELVGLGARLDHFPAQLSGGEQQRVAIARAIAKRPEVLLCDEPTGALDVATGIVVLEAIERVNRELGTTTAVITHNAAIADMADRVVTLSDGRIASEKRNERRARREPRVVKLRALDRKLLRDLFHMKGQALAIAVVLAGGVATFVMSISTMQSLEAARALYYDRHRFADVFASLERAPLSLAGRLEEIPGIARVEPRVTTEARLLVPGMVEPASARLLSLPRRAGGLNALHLREGRSVTRDGRLEVVVSEPFAEAHGYGPGDALEAVIRGRRERLRIVGIGLSPEFVFQIRPGEFLPDHRRYAILWMDYEQLAPAVDMDGAFNDVTVRLQPGASEPAVLDRLDRLLEPYGGLGAYGRAHQVSNEFVTNELRQLRGMAMIPPSIFLAVAAFLLNVVVGRVVATQRDQIAVLKAFGHDRVEVGVHYLELVLSIVAVGIVLGVAGGAWLGSGMLVLYEEFFRFPSFDYRLGPLAVGPAIAIAVLAAVAGTIGAVGRAVRLPPAEAMRPEAPATFHATILERLGFERWLSPAARMILRNLERHPVKAALSALGLSLAVALLVLGTFFEDAVESVMEHQFFRAQRQDVTLTFTDPASASSLYEVGRLPGVLRAEPFRSVPVTIRAAHRSRRLAILGLGRDGRLQQVLDAEKGPVSLPAEGLAVSEMLAEILRVAPGDRVTVEVMEGERPTRELRVNALVRDFAGMSAWMNLMALHRWMEEGDVLSGAFLSLDAARERRFWEAVRETPGIAGVTTRSAAVASFRETLAENLGMMRFFNVVFAGVIAVGVVYNAARIALSERARELATLRILGFTRAEISTILLGELAVLVLLSILPGLVLGYGLAAFVTVAVATESQRFPLVVSPRTFSFAVTVVVTAAILSGLVVRRRLDRLDLVAVLKSRE